MPELVASVVGYNTYKYYAKIYGIKISFKSTNGKRILKPIAQLSNEIKNYEHNNNITHGLYY